MSRDLKAFLLRCVDRKLGTFLHTCPLHARFSMIILCTLQYDVADLGLFEEPALKSLCMHVFAFIHNFWQYFPAIIRCCAMHYSIVGEHIHVVFGLFLKYLDKGGAFLRELCSCFHTEVIYREWFSIDCIEVRRESEDLTDGFR